ncbi:MAG: hypothetical protein WBW33_15350 [Bryobacteraceae bacterium]
MGSLPFRVILALLTLGLALPASSRQETGDPARAMDRGEKALASNRLQDAITQFEKAVDFDGHSAKAHIGLANALMMSVTGGMVTDMQLATLEPAKREEQLALEIAPNDAEALAGMGELQYRLGFRAGLLSFQKSAGLTDAKNTLGRALATDPNNYHANYQLVRIATSELFWLVTEARAALGLKPGVKQDLSPAAANELRQKCTPVLQAAVAHANAAIAARANAYEAMHELAGLYLIRSLIDESGEEKQADLKMQQDWQTKSQLAYARFQRALAEPQPFVEPHDFQEALTEGRNSAAIYQYESAIRAFDRAVQFNGKSAEAHVELANALIRSASGDSSTYSVDPERLHRAVEEDLKALDLAHDNAEAMAGIAAATYSLKKAAGGKSEGDVYTEARDWVKKALAADANNFRANYLMAVMASQQAGTALFNAQSEAYKKGIRDGSLPPDVSESLRQNYGPLVEEGLRCAQAALKARPGSYLTLHELSNLYNLRSQWSGNSSKADRERSLELAHEAAQRVPKDDPEGELLRTLARLPAMLPPPPPPPAPGPPKQ